MCDRKIVKVGQYLMKLRSYLMAYFLMDYPTVSCALLRVSDVTDVLPSGPENTLHVLASATSSHKHLFICLFGFYRATLC